ncbi:hypothetical protein MAHJHV63_54970 [Mycobacterium avium subsp. hominissuis]
MRHDNSHHLLAAAQRRRADTLQRARKALQELGETGQRRTVTQIAAHAGVGGDLGDGAPPTPAFPVHGSTPNPNCATNCTGSRVGWLRGW